MRRKAPLARAGAAIAVVSALLMPAGTAAVDQQPSSFGQASLYHLSFAAGLDFNTFLPVNNNDIFVEGSPYILILAGWQRAPVGTSLQLRLFQGDRLVYLDARNVVTETNSGYLFGFVPSGGAEIGTYTAQLDYNGLPEETASFRVVAANDPALSGSATTNPGTLPDPTASPDPGTVPGSEPVAQPEGIMPYADPASVLVVTRESVLRPLLGTNADAVFAAAALVGELHDLEADGQTRNTAGDIRDEVHRLLRAGTYEYLLIIGNDDAVPYFQLQNPMGDGETNALAGSGMPADWIPSDDPYTDMDADQLGMPDLAIARIPSSEDAQLLLAQLGEVVSPAGGAYAYLNQSWRAASGVVSEVMDDFVPVIEAYSPPNNAARIAQVSEDNGRFLYVSMHGDGQVSDSFAADVYAWIPREADLDAEWAVERGAQIISMDVTNATAPGGVIKIGTCYGAWTIDTTFTGVGSQKTADNSIALAYLRSGTRAVVGETHLSYAIPIGTDGPYTAASGYEILFWRHLLSGRTPIDAFHQAKLDMAVETLQALQDGEAEFALINLKTIHEEVYFGRP